MNKFNHACTDGAHFRAFSVTSLLYLVRALARETNTENTEKIAIGGLDGSVCFNKSLKYQLRNKQTIATYMPLLDNRAQLVASHGHSVEVGENVFALDVFADKLELSEVSLRSVQISQRDFKHASFQPFGSNFGSLCSVDECLSDLAVGEHRGGLDVIPFLT